MLELHNVYMMKKDFTQAQAEAWIKAHEIIINYNQLI